MENLPFIIAGIIVIVILVLIPALRDLSKNTHKSKYADIPVEPTPDFEKDSSDSCDLGTASLLPSPGALYSEVEADVIGDREVYAQALNIARSLIAEVRKQIHENGSKANYEVVTSQTHDWAVAKVLYSILTANGWSSIKTGERGYKLSWTAYYLRPHEKQSNLPTHKDLVAEVESEIWEDMSEVERAQGRFFSGRSAHQGKRNLSQNRLSFQLLGKNRSTTLAYRKAFQGQPSRGRLVRLS